MLTASDLESMRPSYIQGVIYDSSRTIWLNNSPSVIYLRECISTHIYSIMFTSWDMNNIFKEFFVCNQTTIVI